MEVIIKSARRLIFQLNKKPIRDCKLSFAITRGMPASKLPAGQMSLQKKGLPMPVAR
jgi:hypothetical protein